MSSLDQAFSTAQRQTLLDTARDAIRSGLTDGQPLAIDPARFEEELRVPSATFVTLNERGQLRGCIGHLDAIQALIADVAENAFSAAFRDPRFPPVGGQEFDRLDIHISILSHPVPLTFTSERDLLQQIRPKKDGLILEDGYHRGTFLPSVWEQLPTPKEFLIHLKIKAGLPPDYWSDSIRVSRYTTESFSET